MIRSAFSGRRPDACIFGDSGMGAFRAPFFDRHFAFLNLQGVRA